MSGIRVSEDGGRTSVPCCEYSRIRADEIAASARFARAIRERVSPEQLAEMILDCFQRARAKRDRKSVVQAAVLLLERLPVRGELRRLLVAELAKEQSK